MTNSESTTSHSEAWGSAENPVKHVRARTHSTDIGDSKRTVAFGEYRRSWLTPFFGSNDSEPQFSWNAVHPCKLFSRHVHECLEQHENNVDFCQTRVALLQSCLNEFNM
ncbi:hypothetical protein C3747_135g103c [Trypanosoma cruzi]|uniref:CHCH domain-containing protein n=2 Tax=Trypanosoma cruzi TaxID=5693 RepID=Q4DMR5_TRYCC|nr:hypothetical protein, conserved [Trypanosoma cruzi]EAN93827.1 hypothetical protein, conserved [Trypanosoma cruzi]PWV05268.1 hypothetical protein C3747_135g103c [Trypanosoma cruzi]RNC57046.1 hypothetical protein TcCL_ESM05393 [Trypanosoma cruzi]|eukprot:XP_815678.1 hypothetical protein [Trypanosoma cruzi strain CL Brener]